LKICIIGAGWYGCHVAHVLASAGHSVTLVDKNDDIFQGISGSFGVRLHRGPHYPRSLATRESCHRGYDKFLNHYPDLILRQKPSIYALGTIDSDNKPPKVTKEEFEAVCQETKSAKKIRDFKEWGFNNLITAMDIKENSILLGGRLRDTFRILLEDAKVEIKCRFEVKNLEAYENKIIVSNGEEYQETFDYVINATSYHALLPKENFPFKLDIVYQPCLALIYEDEKSTPLPFSFIVLDGLFPCIMPFVQDDPIKDNKAGHRKYILTHGKWTIMGSYQSVERAQVVLAKIDNNFIESQIKPRCEQEINRFFPEFDKRFKYCGWQGSVLAKIKTNTEFRSAVTFERDRVIYIIPGKVSNIFDVAKEVKKLIEGKDIIKKGSYQYIRDGILDKGITGSCELTETINSAERNTCMLQTFDELFEKSNQKIEESHNPSNPFEDKKLRRHSFFRDKNSNNEIDNKNGNNNLNLIPLGIKN
jgi:hypothetical protein